MLEKYNDEEIQELIKCYEENIERCRYDQRLLDPDDEHYFEDFEELQREIDCNEDLIVLAIERLKKKESN